VDSDLFEQKFLLLFFKKRCFLPSLQPIDFARNDSGDKR